MNTEPSPVQPEDADSTTFPLRSRPLPGDQHVLARRYWARKRYQEANRRLRDIQVYGADGAEILRLMLDGQRSLRAYLAADAEAEAYPPAREGWKQAKARELREFLYELPKHVVEGAVLAMLDRLDRSWP